MEKEDVTVDLLNTEGKSKGQMAEFFKNNQGLNIMSMRPWRGDCGKSFITVYTGGDPKLPGSYKNEIVANSTLRQDEWKSLDDAVLKIAKERLVGINDLITNGLTYPLANAMGTTVFQHDTMSDAMEAVVTMDGVTRGQGDRPEFERVSIPIPVIHSDYEINLRILDSSRRLGENLETLSAELAARKITEKLEDMLFTNTSYTFGGGTIYSYLNFPNRNQVALATAWDAAAATAALILADVLDMKSASIGALHYGPWILYIPTAYEVVLDNDYNAVTPGNTIRTRILSIEGISAIHTADRLADDTVLLVEMRRETVRLITGIPISNIMWKTEGNFINKHKVISIQVPEIRADAAGHSGIVELAA